MERILSMTIEVHGPRALGKQVMSDTTVSENHVTFLADAKQCKKIIDQCCKIAQKEGLQQRQSYKRVSKQLLRDTYNGTHPRRAAKSKKASKKLYTLAGRTLRELERTLTPEQLIKHSDLLSLFSQFLSQTRHSKDKIYSFHKPHTCCIAKGKAHKTYEFGNTVGLIVDVKGLLITAIDGVKGNPHDSKTIVPLLDQHERHTGQLPQELLYDRGGRGIKDYKGLPLVFQANPSNQTPLTRSKRTVRSLENEQA